MQFNERRVHTGVYSLLKRGVGVLLSVSVFYHKRPRYVMFTATMGEDEFLCKINGPAVQILQFFVSNCV